MNKTEYLKRIGIDQTQLNPDLKTLKLLQKRHLLSVPFENLDIHWKQPIKLDTDDFYQKIVRRKRGGFCYEQNGLFRKLLEETGFQTKIISARVAGGENNFGEEYDHLAILVKINGEEYLTDVGFGDFLTEPLKFILDREQSDESGIYKFRKTDNDYFEILKKKDSVWKSQFIFKDLARDLQEFKGMCSFHQTSEKSHFTRGKVCSILTKNGRKTLTDNKFIETKNGEKTEKMIASEEEFNEILEREFGITQ